MEAVLEKWTFLCNWTAGTLYSFPLAKQECLTNMAFSSFMAGILILVSASGVGCQKMD